MFKKTSTESPKRSSTKPGNHVSWLSGQREKEKVRRETKKKTPSSSSSSISSRPPPPKTLSTFQERILNEDGEVGQVKLEDSNIAHIGSKEDKAARKSAAKTEKAWAKAGKKEGLLIWRVENKRTKNGAPAFGVKKWPKEEYGSFHTGDSYIVLNTYHPINPETKKKDKKKHYDIHFWLGSESSQDEIGVAAYKTVELDNLLDDEPVQHRECQFHESKLFQSYFKEVKYLKGGIESGFRKVRPEEYVPRLLMIKQSKRTTKAFEIECKATSMNHGDCFVLDAGREVYRWCGSGATATERMKSGLLQFNLVNSRNGKAKKVEIDEDDSSVVDDSNKEFWKLLGGTYKDVLTMEEGDQNQDLFNELSLKADQVKLFRITDASGKMEFQSEGEGRISRSRLDSNDVFLVDSNIGIWVWQGSKSNKNEKKQSMLYAEKYIRENNLPNTCTISAVSEDRARSNTLFISLFSS